jgi:hypothetical protein
MGAHRKIRRSQVLLEHLGSHQQWPCGGPVGRFEGLFSGLGQTPPCSSRPAQQLAHPHQIVGCRRPREHPPHSCSSPEASLAHPRHRLHPTQDFLHPLAQSLAEAVARVAGGETIDRTSSAAPDSSSTPWRPKPHRPCSSPQTKWENNEDRVGDQSDRLIRLIALGLGEALKEESERVIRSKASLTPLASK